MSTLVSGTRFLPFFENRNIWSTLSFHHSISFPVALKHLHIEKIKVRVRRRVCRGTAWGDAVRVCAWRVALCPERWGRHPHREVTWPRVAGPRQGEAGLHAWGQSSSRCLSQCRPRRHTRRDGLAWGIRAQG